MNIHQCVSATNSRLRHEGTGERRISSGRHCRPAGQHTTERAEGIFRARTPLVNEETTRDTLCSAPAPLLSPLVMRFYSTFAVPPPPPPPPWPSPTTSFATRKAPLSWKIHSPCKKVLDPELAIDHARIRQLDRFILIFWNQSPSCVVRSDFRFSAFACFLFLTDRIFAKVSVVFVVSKLLLEGMLNLDLARLMSLCLSSSDFIFHIRTMELFWSRGEDCWTSVATWNQFLSFCIVPSRRVVFSETVFFSNFTFTLHFRSTEFLESREDVTIFYSFCIICYNFHFLSYVVLALVFRETLNCNLSLS